MNSIFKSLTSTRRLTFSFVIVIFFGSLLLSLPIVHYADAPSTTYLDHLFNVVSMVCVTGLSVVPVASVYNGLGQVIAMCLMQIGGLGLVTLIAISTYLLRRRMNLSEQSLLQSALSYDNNNDLRHYLFNAYKITFIIESLVDIVLLFDFIPRFGLGHGIFNAIFLAVSAFCNAGFDNLGSNSLQDYATNPTINLAVAFLIMSGSLGFAVWIDLIQLIRRYIKDRPRNWKLAWRPFSNQSRLVLISTGCLLLGGTLLAWLLEMDNSKTIGTLNVWQQLLVSFFQTVTMRTAGFATISYTNADFSTNLLFMIQMIIGGGPGGTAGGIKVTTASIMFLLFKSELSGNSSVVFRNRIISNKTILQAFTVILFFLTMLFVGYVILLETNPTLSPLGLLFESVSAIATVGVSMDLTPNLNTLGRLVIMALMFIGRVGPITVLLSLMTKKEKHISYAPTDISVG